MKFDTIQQFIRIVLFGVGGWFLGEGVTESAVFESAVGGVVSVFAFVWWYWWDSTKEHITKS